MELHSVRRHIVSRFSDSLSSVSAAYEVIGSGVEQRNLLKIRILSREHEYCSGRPLSRLYADLEAGCIGSIKSSTMSSGFSAAARSRASAPVEASRMCGKIIGERASNHSPNLIFIVYYERRALRHGSTSHDWDDATIEGRVTIVTRATRESPRGLPAI
jgi:hypothetical protein